MTYTSEKLAKLTKPEILKIAREIQIVGRDRMTRAQLVDAISNTEVSLEHGIEPTTEETTEITTEAANEPIIKNAKIPTPSEFFNLVTALDDKLAIQQACTSLLDLLATNFTVATISKKLTAYKKLFYEYRHPNAELNETVETSKGTNTQHIAARLLTLTDEQKQALGVDRNERDNARAGFNKEGDIREVTTPGIDIAAIIKKSIECLDSNDLHTLGAGILNLSGLRANEQNMSSRMYGEELIERDMVVIDEYTIAFKGISKKKIEDANAYYIRATLAPAQMIVDAQKRFLAKAVQKIPNDYEKYRKGFMQTFYNRYQDLFGSELSTIEAFNDEGKIIDSNGTPHKARAFYSCSLRTILGTYKGFGDSGCNTYIQLCLGHEKVAETARYLGRYDEKDFINPIDIPIPTNIKKLGKMLKSPDTVKVKKTANTLKPVPTTEVKEMTATLVTTKNTFDVDDFTSKLDEDLQIEFKKLLEGTNLNYAILELINNLKKKINTPTITKKTSVSDEIAGIVQAIMEYNSTQNLNTNCVVVSYSLVNKISEKALNKTMAKSTVDTWLKANEDALHENLVTFGIKGGLYDTQWNGKHHRKTMDSVVEAIVNILKK
jgi:Telomere resolvase